ncbi:MAG: AAA family ATPase [Pseudomonadota bacterium]
MRLVRLDLKAFGPFTDRSLEFTTKAPGLHLIYGPNEAGKSSSLRALKALLYGFPQQTPDNFLHTYEQLLVAGCLRNNAGQEISFQRRKKRLGDVLDEAGNPLDSAALTPFLHGIEAPMFASLYGIDHDTLVQGGEEILAQKGEVGQTLFAAGAGLSSVSEVISQLEKEAAELFKATGQLPAINTAIKRFKELQKEARSAGLSVKDWKEHRKALENALAERTELEEERDRKNVELHRLERLRQAVPELAALKSQGERLQALGEVVPLGPDFAERYRQVSQDLREGAQRLQRDRDRLEKLDEKRRGISVNTALLQQAERVDDFHQRLGEYRKGRKDRPERNGMRISLRTEAARLLQQIRPDLPLEKVEVLRPVLAKKKTVQALASQYEAIKQQVAAAEKQGRVAEEELRRVESRLAVLPAAVDTGNFLLALKPAQKVGDLDGQLASSRSDIILQKKECQAELKRIGLWTGDLTALVTLALPLAATVQQFEKSFGELDEVRREIEKSRKNSEKELQQVLAEIRKVDTGDVPREEDLTRSRALRERGWRLLRRQWLDREDVAEESLDYAPEKPLAETYEGYVGQSDDIADLLRREADRVAGMAALRSRVQSLEEALADNEWEKQALVLKAGEQEQRWHKVWQSVDIVPLSPREMSSWLTEIDKLRFKVVDLCRKEELLSRAMQHRKELQEAMRKELTDIGEAAPDGEELGPVLIVAENVLARLTNREKEREKFRDRLEKAAKDQRQAAEDLRAAGESMAGWSKEWRKALVGLGQEDLTTLEAVDLLETLQRCFEKIKEAEDLQKRIDGIDRDAAELDMEVKTQVAKVAPTLSTLPLDQAILQLRTLLDQAQKDSALHAELTKDLSVLQEEIGVTENGLLAAQGQMAELLALSHCQNPADLPLIIDRFAEYQRLREKIVDHEESLAKIGSGVPLAELAAQAAEVNIDELPSVMEALLRDIKERLNPEINRLSQAVGEESTRLAAMDGSARAAELAEAMERELAKIRRFADRYTLVKLASRVLQQAIDRYREEHQDPVLKIAAGYFQQLTLASFAGLRTDVDDGGQPVLVGVRENGSRLTVDKMSSGTRDQMFLALRLATLTWRLQTGEPIPFIVDDILINFDDARSRATLKILADLGERNQVILFTHHRRIVEEARQLAGQGEIQIHELAS